jgi:hypothetical protein
MLQILLFAISCSMRARKEISYEARRRSQVRLATCYHYQQVSRQSKSKRYILIITNSPIIHTIFKNKL